MTTQNQFAQSSNTFKPNNLQQEILTDLVLNLKATLETTPHDIADKYAPLVSLSIAGCKFLEKIAMGESEPISNDTFESICIGFKSLALEIRIREAELRLKNTKEQELKQNKGQ